jgi:hypothetical protein
MIDAMGVPPRWVSSQRGASPGGRVKRRPAGIECRSSPSGGKGFPVKKFLLLLIVVALGAAVAYKVRGDA